MTNADTTPMKKLLCLVIAISMGSFSIARAATNASEVFGHSVLPILQAKCLTCHGDKLRMKGGLDLTTLGRTLKGGDSGSAVVPGKSAESLIVQMITDGEMPPDGKAAPVTAIELDVIRRWIDESSFPDAKQLETLQKPVSHSDHWAFQPRSMVAPPKMVDAAWSDNPIDRFVWEKHVENGLVPVGLADPVTLLRRVTLDLTGLPPTPDELDAFLESCRVDDENGRARPTDDERIGDLPASQALPAWSSSPAFERVVDRLLQSPEYGRRWGRHWLDVARYADTSGCLGDYPIPWMYRYRDWVIQALNMDLPYDEFIRWQLAGDVLAQSAKDDTTYADQMIATGFIAASRRFGLRRGEAQHLTIEDTIDTVGRGLLGVTMRCARCHDHKFDPIPTDDYYALYGIFSSTRYPFCGSSEYRVPTDLVALARDAAERREAEMRMERIIDYTRQLRAPASMKQPKEQRYRELIKELDEARARGGDITEPQRQLDQFLESTPDLSAWLLLGKAELTKRRDELAAAWADSIEPMAYAVSEGDPADAAVQRRGDPKLPERIVPRGFLRAIQNVDSPEIKQGSGRLELAQWITAPEHPLTARVIVNRIWQWHFGRGLVATSDSFGTMGTPPSHLALLDWLAERFIADGWSIQKLHRRIVFSRTYQLASGDAPANRRSDGENVWLWHFRPRRLEAEAIRDSMMHVSGTLDYRSAGPPPFPKWYVGRGYNLNYPFDAMEYPSSHRSVYLMTQRLFAHPYLGLFDGPNTTQTTTLRLSADVPTQTLYLLNSPFVVEQSRSLAHRILSEADGDDESRIKHAYRLAFARDPQTDEVATATAFLSEARGLGGNKVDRQITAWSAFAKALLISNEFLYLN